MKVLFLDIDGVVNCAKTAARYRGIIGIDPYMGFLVGRVISNTDAKVVLSSSWRGWPEGEEEVRKQVCNFIDCTNQLPNEEAIRGDEIKEWLDRHPEVKRYAILDDANDMLPEQMDHLFQTEWEVGLTPEIADKIISYLNS